MTTSPFVVVPQCECWRRRGGEGRIRASGDHHAPRGHTYQEGVEGVKEEVGGRVVQLV